MGSDAMSKRGRIPISDAAEICKKRGCAYVIVFGVAENGEQFHVATYGRSKALCKVAGAIGDQIADAILSGKVAPPSEEPEDGPAETMVRRRREDERDDLLGMFKGLLAVIHRDGGQYVDKHGLKKACEDAHQVWAGLRYDNERLEAEVTRLRAALLELESGWDPARK